MKVQIIKPDSKDQRQVYDACFFLAGSIEMGAAEDWQKLVEDKFKNDPVTIFNPRRDSWDSSWEQRIHSEPFYNQVTWELERLDESDIILMYFDPNTKSPISLLELGLYAKDEKIIVVCPDGFWRKGNVEIVCKREGIPMLKDLNEAVEYIKDEFGLNEDE